MRRIFTRPKGQKKSREEIEKEAFAAMRKAKAAIDPGVLAKIRKAIEKSPMAGQIMGGLGKEKVKSEDAVAEDKKKKALEAARKAHSNVKVPEPLTEKETESVDQAKILDIVAKTLELNPHKSGLKKGVKEILLDKKG